MKIGYGSMYIQRLELCSSEERCNYLTLHLSDGINKVIVETNFVYYEELRESFLAQKPINLNMKLT